MLGNNLYRIENCIDLSNDDVKSLSLFYRPLIGSHAFSLYMNLCFTEMFAGYHELNELCVLMNVSIDKLEEMLGVLNRYKLLKTLKKEDEERYILILERPLTTLQFIKNSIFVRLFILQCSGEVYQNILAGLKEVGGSHKGFKDISKKMEADILDNWSMDKESYIEKKKDDSIYRLDCLFDINDFLKDISENLFPRKYRTYENLKLIGDMADLYNISPEKMRTYIPKVIRSTSNEFDSKLFKSLCMSSVSNYTLIDSKNYNVPCVLFLMNLENGKEVTEHERRILMNLKDSYHLNPSVINTLMEEHLKKFDNRIIEKILYSQASDLHRNNADNHESALVRLVNKTDAKVKTKDTLVDYNAYENGDVDMSNLEAFLKEREKQ